MLVVGVDLSGVELYRARLPHGADPAPLSYDLGFVAEQPLDVRRGPDGELTLWFLARPVADERRPPERPPGRDPNLMVVAPGETTTRQRVAAYAVVLSDRGLLATQYSDKTAVEGRWGMPGGGIDAGEEPADTVVREVHEETSRPLSSVTWWPCRPRTGSAVTPRVRSRTSMPSG